MKRIVTASDDVGFATQSLFGLTWTWTWTLTVRVRVWVHVPKHDPELEIVLGGGSMGRTHH